MSLTGLKMDFRPIFVLNRHFLVKLKANSFGFESKLDTFQKPQKMCATP
jgi:hypothetical protein